MKLFTFAQFSAFAAIYRVLSTKFKSEAGEVGREL